MPKSTRSSTPATPAANRMDAGIGRRQRGRPRTRATQSGVRARRVRIDDVPTPVVRSQHPALGQPELPIEPAPGPSGSESQQARRDTVWIVGDSIIRRAQTNMDCEAQIHWMGKGGAGIGNFLPLLSRLDALAHGVAPTVVVIHLGTNDLVSIDTFCMRQRIRLLMEEFRTRYPSVCLVWSDILPRLFYYGAQSNASINKKRLTLNKWARAMAYRLNAYIFHHPQFESCPSQLFHFDGVNLSPEGTRLFRDNLQSCIIGLLRSFYY
ncbi:uncharacterized protein LOC119726141 [Patiria miniata]|uniref:SGNH hydrolase-type esterase domain-containing protein n=1 Tax=Patiria miniata TaxID=46514 RepID=A0A913ZPN3_PATMI|nr:uncharacterized protein LOC119726141 [Patiria miniata]